MKQLFKITALLLFVFTSAGFTACSDDDDEGDPSSLIGTWRCDLGHGEYEEISVKADGTGYVLSVWYVNGQRESRVDYITWRYNKGIFTIRYDQDGEVESWPITIHGNVVTVNGLRYVRVG